MSALIAGLAAHSFDAAARTATPMLIVESCDFWSYPAMWQAVIDKRPEWKPLLGFYDSADERVTDAHIAMLVSHAVSAVQSCWYRGKADTAGTVDSFFIESLTRPGRKPSALPWCLDWDNVNPVGGRVTGPEDFLRTVARPWTEKYFSRPDYLKIDGKPLVTIANAPAFAAELGGPSAAKAALVGLRKLVARTGLPGVLIVTTNNGLQTDDETLARGIGFDAVSMYATPTFTGLLRSTSPSDQAVIEAERRSWALAARHSTIAPIVTASVGFDARPWSEGALHFMLSVADWRSLLQSAIGTARSRPAASLGHRIVLLDALNEFGEGHFIEPTQAFGTAYLDAVTRVACAAAITPAPDPCPR